MTERELFVAALHLTEPAVRDAFLDQACGADRTLRDRAAALLADHEKLGSFLEAPAPVASDVTGAYTPAPPAPKSDLTGAVVAGRYKLLQKIGEGGMGDVYMAEQSQPIKRRVALKVIKAGMDSGRILARFEAERQALALMDHPNIARVLDAGTTDSNSPFFVMELVKGVPLTQFCDEHKLAIGDRLAIFIQICSAVQHAHQKGIIHRDLKPTNILVESHDGRPVPKVIDFGLAKATSGIPLTEHSLFTAFGTVAGTPLYMAPEQANFNALDVDTRSDIYALGVILYELLTGTTPIERETVRKKALDEVMRVLREEEPPTPSSRLSKSESAAGAAAVRGMEPLKLGRFVKGELDWIVMKALSKERDRRYETANGFARDIERFLNHEAVLAGPPSTRYKLKKFVRRNRGQVIAAGFVLFALLAGMAGTTWGLIEARRQERIARAESAEKEEARRAEAERAEGEAKERKRAEAGEKLAGERLVQVAAERDAKEVARQDAEAISKFLGEVFRSPDPSRDGRTITVAETLDRAAQQLAADRAIAPGRRATLQGTLGRTYHSLGLDRQAIPLQEAARDYYLSTTGPEHPAALAAMNELAISYFAAGRREEALKLREEVLRLCRRVLGPEHPGTLSAMNSLANSYFAAGRREEALKLQEEVLTLRLKLNGPEHPDTLTAMSYPANSYSEAGRREEALELRREEVLALRRKVLGPEHPATLLAMDGLAASYFAAGRREEALKLQEEVLTLSRKVHGQEHPAALLAMNNLANSYFDAGRWEEALKLRQEVLTLRRKALGPEHPDTLQAMNNLAFSYSDAGRRAEALELREEVLALRRKVLGPEHPDTLLAMGNLANSYSDAGRRAEALELREEVLAHRRKVLGPEHPDTLLAMGNLADSYSDAGRRAEALKLREEVLALRSKVFGPEHPDTLTAMNKLAFSYADAGMTERALGLRREWLALYRKRLPKESPQLAGTLASFGSALVSAKDFSEAESILRECLAIRGKTEPDSWTAFNAQSLLGGALLGQKKYAEAEPLLLKGYEGMKERQKAIPKAAGTRIPEALDRLVELYAATNRPDEAKKWRTERAKYPAEVLPVPREVK